MADFKMSNIPRAATTDVGLMAYKLIFERDFSVVVPLLDELKISDRHEDACRLTQFLGSFLANNYVPGHWHQQKWIDVQSSLLMIFWFDIFDMTSSLVVMDGLIKREDNRPVPNITAGDWTRNTVYSAAADIQAGQRVTLNENGSVVPAHPPVVSREVTDRAFNIEANQ